jgi:hypothetical protein
MDAGGATVVTKRLLGRKWYQMDCGSSVNYSESENVKRGNASCSGELVAILPITIRGR